MNRIHMISFMILGFIFLSIPPVKGTNSEEQRNFFAEKTEKINVRFSLKDGEYKEYHYHVDNKGQAAEFSSWEDFTIHLNKNIPLLSAIFFHAPHASYLNRFLKNNDTLKKLTLKNAGEFSHQKKPFILDGIFINIESLRLSDSNCLRASDILSSFPNLTYLNISSFIFFDHSKLNLLKKLKTLEINNLREGVSFLPVLNNLEKIIIEDNNMETYTETVELYKKVDTHTVLNNHQNLKEIYIKKHKLTSLFIFGTITSLTTLDLGHFDVRQIDLLPLQNLKKLSRLEIRAAELSSLKILPSLPLRFLKISMCKIDDTKVFGECQQLEFLDISWGHIENTKWNGLKNHPNLKHLVIHCTFPRGKELKWLRKGKYEKLSVFFDVLTTFPKLERLGFIDGNEKFQNYLNEKYPNKKIIIEKE